MAKRALWPAVRTAATIFVYATFAVLALAFADYALGQRGPAGLRRLYLLTRLPERQLGQSWASPARLRGTLHTAQPRLTPTGSPSAIWYGWVEEVRGSGKNSYTVLLCARGEDDALQLRQGERAAGLSLFAPDGDAAHVALIKGRTLETLPLNRVALDFGELYKSSQIPLPMQRLCTGKLPPTGKLSYYEARIPPGGSVTVLGCASAGVVHSCGVPPGAISVRELRPVFRAYANDTLSGIRAAAAVVGIALSLLASALFKLREAPAGSS